MSDNNINRESELLVIHAMELFSKIPEKKIDAMEYLTLADFLINTSYYNEAIHNINMALTKKNIYIEQKITALRLLGHIYIVTGETNKGRKYYEESILTIEKMSNKNKTIMIQNIVLTELRWAISENTILQSDSAKKHIDKAVKAIMSESENYIPPHLYSYIEAAMAFLNFPNTEYGSLINYNSRLLFENVKPIDSASELLKEIKENPQSYLKVRVQLNPTD